MKVICFLFRCFMGIEGFYFINQQIMAAYDYAISYNRLIKGYFVCGISNRFRASLWRCSIALGSKPWISSLNT